MSCERLVEQLERRVEEFPEGSRDKIGPASLVQRLINTCPTGRSRITHTAKILNAQRESEKDRVLQESKQEAEEYLK